MMHAINGKFHYLHGRRRKVTRWSNMLNSEFGMFNSGCKFYEWSNFEFKAVCGVGSPDYDEY